MLFSTWRTPGKEGRAAGVSGHLFPAHFPSSPVLTPCSSQGSVYLSRDSLKKLSCSFSFKLSSA